ncbi:hypothetical protein RF11_00428 [Thelohanellus kitauei]|uniref:Uncharacterized protein n=1 Tax=Thelohanellus kitauei TaxID=669202 RepID=A0A0C2JJI0_THEKT|nr:hypothetical protein RF11_00428 [Thelohanellus kitauei]
MFTGTFPSFPRKIHFAIEICANNVVTWVIKSPCPTPDVLSNILDQHVMVKPMYLLYICYSELVIEFASLILNRGIGLKFVNIAYYLALEYRNKVSLKSAGKVAVATSAVEQAREELDKAMESYIASFENMKLGNINHVVKAALRSILNKPGELEKNVVNYVADHLSDAVRSLRRKRNKDWRDHALSIDESISSNSTAVKARPNTDSGDSISAHSSKSGSVGGHGKSYLEIDTIPTSSKNGSKYDKSDDYEIPFNPQADVSSIRRRSNDTVDAESPRLPC